MKKIYQLFFALLLSSVALAQSPEAINYQAVLRNAQGDLIISKSVSLRLSVLKGRYKSKPTLKLLGCSFEECWQHLESKFQPGMTKENYGLWHVDHIRPCVSFDLTDPEQQKICFHYTNLQPLWAIDNMKKGSKINYEVE